MSGLDRFPAAAALALLVAVAPAASQPAPEAEQSSPPDPTPDSEPTDQERRRQALDDHLLEWEFDAPGPLGRPLKWSWRWDRGIHVDSTNGLHRAHLGGRLLLDAGLLHFGAGLADVAEPGWSSDAEVRSGRLLAQGIFFRRILAKAEYEFAGSEAKDVFVGLRGLGPLGTAKLGYMKEPTSLEEQQSSLHLMFMERSLANALVPKRNSGLLLTNTLLDDRLRWAVGGFRIVQSFEARDETIPGLDNAWDLSARLNGLLWSRDEGRHLLEAGVSYTHTFGRDLQATFKSRPESHLAPNLIATPEIDGIDGLDRLGLEAAWVRGPVSLQAELVLLHLGRDPGASLRFWGGYLQGSYFLTGEQRVYGAKAGAFGRILPQRPFSWAQRHWGAFELAARLSTLDLDDREIEGGRELNLTLGANWYLLGNVKLMANAVYAHVRSADDAFILQARFQVDF